MYKTNFSDAMMEPKLQSCDSVAAYAVVNIAYLDETQKYFNTEINSSDYKQIACCNYSLAVDNATPTENYKQVESLNIRSLDEDEYQKLNNETATSTNLDIDRTQRVPSCIQNSAVLYSAVNKTKI